MTTQFEGWVMFDISSGSPIVRRAVRVSEIGSIDITNIGEAAVKPSRNVTWLPFIATLNSFNREVLGVGRATGAVDV